jgi:hypothetical protein
VNALSGLSASFIVNILRVCWLIKCALALIPPGTGYGRIIIGPRVNSTVGCVLWVSTRVDLCFSCGLPTSVGIICNGIRVIAGTSLGVLLRIWYQCVHFVLIKSPFAVGSHAFIMGGASVICWIGSSTLVIARGAAALGTLTLCSCWYSVCCRWLF